MARAPRAGGVYLKADGATFVTADGKETEAPTTAELEDAELTPEQRAAKKTARVAAKAVKTETRATAKQARAAERAAAKAARKTAKADAKAARAVTKVSRAKSSRK